jgi:hypothetical protein
MGDDDLNFFHVGHYRGMITDAAPGYCVRIETLALPAADHGDTTTLRSLAELREQAGDHAGAKTLALETANHGDTNALCSLARRR